MPSKRGRSPALRAVLASTVALAAWVPAARAASPVVPFVISGGLGPSGVRRTEGLGTEYAYGGSGCMHFGYDVTPELTPWVGIDGARWEPKDASRGLWQASAMGGVRRSFMAGTARPWLEAAIGYGRFKNDSINVQTGLRLQVAVGADWAAGAFGRVGFYLGADYTRPSDGTGYPYKWAGAGVTFAVHALDVH